MGALQLIDILNVLKCIGAAKGPNIETIKRFSDRDWQVLNEFSVAQNFCAFRHFCDFRLNFLTSRPKIQFKVGSVKQNFLIRPTIQPLGPKNEQRLNRWPYQKILLHGPHFKLNFRSRVTKFEPKISNLRELHPIRFYVFL